MHELTELIRQDMRPALGVTEPGAIAFAVATARRQLRGEVEEVRLRLNSGMLKNAFTCGIPGSEEVGSAYAAALGALGADPEKQLECLDGMGPGEYAAAKEMVEQNRIKVELSGITSHIFIEAQVKNAEEWATVVIRDGHTNITEITANGSTIFSKAQEAHGGQDAPPVIHQYTLEQMADYATHVPAEELDFIWQAYEVNQKLFEEGMASPRTTFAPFLYKKNGGKVLSDNLHDTAALLCGGAIEARVIGLNRAAMSITGSGAHGIIATMPLYAAYKLEGYTREQLLRATALSYLVCMYIKEYSGKLSAFCGCAIAAGTGAACGLVLLRGGTAEQLGRTVRNMASSITGMICDGGNQGCTMKGLAAVDAALCAAELAMNGVGVDAVHGINGPTPEDTMRYMGQIASPGMEGTEKTILDILLEKSGG